MVTYIISYGIHVLVALVFFILIPLPYLIKGSLLDREESFQKLLSIYQPILLVAHGALVVSVVSGLLMVADWTSLWVWGVIVLWVAIGAWLGLTAKGIRLLKGNQESSEERAVLVTNLKKHSLFLMVAIIAMFALKIFRYF
ncbi:hypothetical protein P4637_09505 [Halalkalibacterium halodurans]|uniref:hypothetical protein n=1 Tax=Halalkalibacterium halodurans TaxID=86665 RepID=UPI00031344B0|nr:hypothetical protein [Halalkalibacterium halodurans]MDY7222881.1 hypothetical protein [Halalkalibacterium halodurans]MDY7242102.1 hypothetical protein [Halalkalibacterium halodurans]MED3648107.1 hypothetical protein [Halalkalibacterium halodurans]MED4080887.1 hypothetical protein [Halalkalibacterium halodurans]MED4085070.1 hypothetical protein [Halalkalibacterium halodurans]